MILRKQYCKRTLVRVDESGFYLLPAVCRTYARRPNTDAASLKDHLSAISGIAPEGRLFMLVQQRAFRSDGVVRFLEHPLHHIPGELLIIWDGSPIHRSQVIRDFLAHGAAERIHLERLPG